MRKSAHLISEYPSKTADGNGLSVTLDELMQMRRYMSYGKMQRRMKTCANQAGDIKSAFKGRGVEMEEIREYSFGDDVRDIDWRVTARKEKPYTKIYLEERDREIYVWLDLSSLMMFGSTFELKSVTAAKLAALIGWAALDNKDRFGCIIFDGKQSWLFKPKNDRAYLAAILKKIAEVSEKALRNTDNDEEERAKSLRLLQANVKNKASVFIISSFAGWGDEFDASLAALAQKNRLFMLNIFDKLEEQAPPAGQYMAQYGDEKLVFDTEFADYRQKYAAYFAQKRAKREKFCRQFGCRLMNFCPGMSLVSALKIF